MKDDFSVFIGFDPREAACFAVARDSVRRNCTVPVPIRGIALDVVRGDMYRRKHKVKRGQLWDKISGAPMSTEFAISRFLTPILAETPYAIFMDCDMLARVNFATLFRDGIVDPSKAVSVVKHKHNPASNVKMDGQIQTRYARKNWSSFMVFNTLHPANTGLTVELINSVPGRDLHAFCWLDDDEIGELPAEWNYLVGHTKLPAGIEPKVIHWTDGPPCMPGFEDVEYADEFRKALVQWCR